MQKIEIGTILYRARMEKGISGKVLCKGLCRVSTMSYYENNKRVPDSLLFYYFMQRLGIAPEDYAIMLSREEYGYFIWKEKTEEKIEKKEWDSLQALLQEDEAICIKCNERIQMQYYYYLKAILEMQKYGNAKQGVEFLRMAAEQTIPDISDFSSDTIMLGTTELNILMNYLYYGFLNQILDSEVAEELFGKLEKYISQGVMERNEQAKVYPKLICIWDRIFDGEINRQQSLSLYSKATALLKETYTLYDITELLKNYVEILKMVNPQEAKMLGKQNEVIKEILEENGIDTCFRPEVLWGRRPKLYLVHEYFQMCRMNQEMTQEELSDGICEPETYSRLERGTRMPTVKNYTALAKRLKIGWGYYRGELSTDDYKVYELRRMQRKEALKENWEEVDRILEIMKKSLDMSEINNYQYIMSNQNMAKYYMGKITEKEVYESNKKLLSLTVPFDMKKDRAYYYSQTELEIITHMAVMLRKVGKLEEGIELLEDVLKRIGRSEVDVEFQWNGVAFAIRVLSELYFSQGRYEKAARIEKYVLEGNLKRMNAGSLLQMLDAIADNLEHMGEQYSNEYMKLYCQTYYVADFFEFEKIKAFSRKYYERLCGNKINWYEN